MSLAIPCLVPRRGGGFVARNEQWAKGKLSHSSELPYFITIVDALYLTCMFIFITIYNITGSRFIYLKKIEITITKSKIDKH